jgi:hypothetical protein
MIEIAYAGCLLSLCFGCPLWLAALADPNPRKRIKVVALIAVQIILLAVCDRYLPPKSVEHFFTPVAHTAKLTTT